MQNRVIIERNGTFRWELGVLHTYFPCSLSFWCVLRVWRFKQRAFYINSMRVKIILACQEVLKRIWPSFKFKRYLQAWELLILYAKNQWKIIWDQPLHKKVPLILLIALLLMKRFLILMKKTQNSFNNKTTLTKNVLGIYIWLTWSRGVIPHSPVKSWT